MATRFLSDTEIGELESWPSELLRSDLVTFFKLGDDEIRWIRGHRILRNQLALAVLLTGIPFLGFVPDLETTPAEVLDHLSDPLNIESGSLGSTSGPVG